MSNIWMRPKVYLEILDEGEARLRETECPLDETKSLIWMIPNVHLDDPNVHSEDTECPIFG